MSTLKVNSIEPANAGSEDYFLARAWVNISGIGTVAIRNDGNVSSVTDLGTGYYRTTFASAFSALDFCFTGMSTGQTTGPNGEIVLWAESVSTSLMETYGSTGGGAAVDIDHACIEVTR